MREVAERAGVALSSVSRVLTGHPAVSESLRQRVLSAVSEMNYEPDFTAMSLRRGSTMTVAFLVRDIASPLFSDMVKAAEEHLGKFGYSMLLTNSDGNPDLDASHIRLFARRRVDGLILSLGSETHRDTLEALRSLRAPIVLIDRQIPDLAASAVLSDHHDGLRAAVRHLAESGHRRIALVTGPHDVLASRERLRGYKAGLRSVGIRFDGNLARLGSYSTEFGYQQSKQLLEEREPPTAIISGGATVTYGALRAAGEAGLRVPSELAIVSCDSWPFRELFRPSLTVVDRDASLIGSTAAELLLDSIRTGATREEHLPTVLVPGDSIADGSAAGARAISSLQDR